MIATKFSNLLTLIKLLWSSFECR